MPDKSEGFDELRSEVLSKVGLSPTHPFDHDEPVEGEPEEQQEPEGDGEPRTEVVEPAEPDNAEEIFNQYIQELESPEPEGEGGEPEPSKEYQSELDRVRQELADLKSSWKEEFDKSRAELEPKPVEKVEEKVNWRSPEIVKVLGQRLDLDEDQALEAADLLGEMTEIQVERATKPMVDSARQKEEEELRRQKASQLKETLESNAKQALAEAKESGGVEAQVILDAERRGEDSLLVRRLRENPSAFFSKENMRNLVSRVAMEATRGKGRARTVVERTAGEGIVGSREQVTAAMTKASNASNETTSQELTPEQEIQQGILKVKSRKSRLPAYMRG